MRAVLTRYRLKTTFAVPAVMAEIHADTIRALREEGHEIAAHGFKHEDVSLLGRDDERARLERRGLERATAFAWPVVAAAYERVYEAVIARRHHHGG